MNLYDLGYGIALAASAPVWLVWPAARRRVRRLFREQMGPDALPGDASPAPRLLIHAVSLGEMNATRSLIDLLRARQPGLRITVSATTETGYARARELYAPDGNAGASNIDVIRYPFDFTSAIRRTLDAVRPDMVVLMELEVWPNFVRQCHARGIDVVLINGRLTASSYRKYRLIRPVVATMLRRLTGLCVQDAGYAKRFIDLGAPAGRILVTGTMKFDTARISDINGETSRQLCRSLGLTPGLERIWVCGSTGPGEEQIILRTYRGLLQRYGRLRLVIVPRHPQRFDEVAELIQQHKFKLIRRSHAEPAPTSPPIPPVVLGDTMGELRRFYAIADLVLVGRSLVDLGTRQHGSDMIEPAALAKPVMIGPFTGNFAEAVRRFMASEAMVVVEPDNLATAVTRLLDHPAEAAAMGRRAMQVVATEQGATARHADLILSLLRRRQTRAAATTPQAAR
jgi:3-deoxy-D-manno-octulosonic-acid transferase